MNNKMSFAKINMRNEFLWVDWSFHIFKNIKYNLAIKSNEMHTAVFPQNSSLQNSFFFLKKNYSNFHSATGF